MLRLICRLLGHRWVRTYERAGMGPIWCDRCGYVERRSEPPVTFDFTGVSNI